MELCRTSYIILAILRTANATSKIHAMTVSEISGLERQAKPNTIHKKLKELETCRFVSEGVKFGRAKTYFLTNEGAGILPAKQTKMQSEVSKQ